MCKKAISLILFISALNISSATWADLVGYWTFNEGAGTTANDTSGNGNNGSLKGNPKWVVGHFGGALEFDGSDDYVDCGSNASLNLTKWTVSFWLKANENKDYNGFVIKGLDAAENYEVLGFADGSFHFPIAFADGTRSYVNTPTGVIIPGEWAHFAYSYDPAEGRRFYKDGSLVFSDSESKTPRSSTASLTLGNEQPMGRYVNGVMDDVRIYNHAQTEPEILAAMEGSRGYPYALGPKPADGALHADTWVTLSWRPGDFAVSHDVYLGEKLGDVEQATHDSALFRGNQTGTFYVAGFPGFAYPEGLVPGTTYFWRIDEVNAADPNSPWKGKVWRFSIPPKTAYNPKPADGAEFVDPNVKPGWTAGFGAKLHTVYFGDNFDTVNNAAGGPPQGTATYNPGTLKSEKVYYWRVDEFDGKGTYKGDIWAFTTPGAAGSPKPANGASGVQMISKLSWTPATNATSHDVYFGTDKNAVRNATTASPEFKGNKAKGSETYDPGKLAWYTPYYWRVDAVYATGTVKGLVWSFTTGDFLLVDDFESYNDLDPPNAASNRIFDKWVDGFANPTTNGALVGNNMPPYAERTIVHSGVQAMPYAYDNANKTSEATMTLVYPRDWTEEGVAKLSLWFRGDPANAAERMYIALNGNAVVYHADPKATQKGGWNQWIIDLSSFQGVILTNVNTISIGFGTKGSPAAGGKGKVYFDDIRLVRP